MNTNVFLKTPRTVVIGIVCVLLVFGGGYFLGTNKAPLRQGSAGQAKSSGPTPTLNPSTDSNQTEPTVLPSSTPTQTLQPPTATSVPAASSSLGFFIYPNTISKSTTDTTATLVSTDDVSAITNWYQNQINASGMHATSFVKTSTNDDVLNKLEGANASLKVDVAISKPSGSNDVSISVDLQNN